MKKTNYENKMTTQEVISSIPKKRETNYILIAPNGNQYSVPEERMENFKSALGVDDTWKIS